MPGVAVWQLLQVKMFRSKAVELNSWAPRAALGPLAGFGKLRSRFSFGFGGELSDWMNVGKAAISFAVNWGGPPTKLLKTGVKLASFCRSPPQRDGSVPPI